MQYFSSIALMIAVVGSTVADADDRRATRITPGFQVELLKVWPALRKAPRQQLATIEFWVKPDKAALARARSFIFILSNQGGRDTAGISLTLFGGKIRASALATQLNATSPLLPDQWAHVALTLDPRTVNKQATLWINGKQVGQRLFLQFWPRTFEVGELCSDHWNQGRAFSGQLGDVRISSIVRYRQPFTPPQRLEKDEHSALLLRGDRLKTPQ